MELRRFFDRAVQASFHDLALRDEPVAGYLADMLTRFARTENLFPTGADDAAAGECRRLAAGGAGGLGRCSTHFGPERELSVRRHIGDYTLFMTGVFRERVERLASTELLRQPGPARLPLRVRARPRHERRARARGGTLYARLAERFEHYAWALDYARRVHFYDAPAHPFFRLGWQ